MSKGLVAIHTPASIYSSFGGKAFRLYSKLIEAPAR